MINGSDSANYLRVEEPGTPPAPLYEDSPLASSLRSRGVPAYYNPRPLKQYDFRFDIKKREFPTLNDAVCCLHLCIKDLPDEWSQRLQDQQPGRVPAAHSDMDWNILKQEMTITLQHYWSIHSGIVAFDWFVAMIPALQWSISCKDSFGNVIDLSDRISMTTGAKPTTTTTTTIHTTPPTSVIVPNREGKEGKYYDDNGIDDQIRRELLFGRRHRNATQKFKKKSLHYHAHLLECHDNNSPYKITAAHWGGSAGMRHMWNSLSPERQHQLEQQLLQRIHGISTMKAGHFFDWLTQQDTILSTIDVTDLEEIRRCMVKVEFDGAFVMDALAIVICSKCNDRNLLYCELMDVGFTTEAANRIQGVLFGFDLLMAEF